LLLFKVAIARYFAFVATCQLVYLLEPQLKKIVKNYYLFVKEVRIFIFLGFFFQYRIEANIQPGNKASISLVKRLGFTQEGFSEKYLQINGEWRDHQRWALTVENWV
jgi:hypothetical protein